MKALLVIDLQNSFISGGSLPVPDGESIIPIVNSLIEKGGYDIIVASQDWHPPHHGSFASQHPGKQPFQIGELSGKPQMLWPDHCIAGSFDSELSSSLNIKKIDYIQKKGQNPFVDSYSAFADAEGVSTGLADYLISKKITQLDLCGLAIDYCVKFSALDAVKKLPTIKVFFIKDASRGISDKGTQAAIQEMHESGVEIINTRDRIKTI
ncbi:Nicotinamidase [Liberibacter crescens BT-1]|uniref:nicotinamidase n=1 Tax=Liberibacter crescens (strain BT-1) TaxID=1215343 RepID=L0EV27_LIBCB|nr:bifunctional nicotinamidase/pyrazinamidase [Liberibacter crescens]AGA64700.1 Nicotinamidase [Liberibacter crescens BT-1]AMC12794.1 PncA [Liberibacter crescens]